MPEPSSIAVDGKPSTFGFLVEPLGWVQDRLGRAIEAEPNLLGPLLNLDQARMHLVALALAYLTDNVTPDLALMLLQGSRKDILRLSVGHHPIGLYRVLRHLPPKVLAAEAYRNLIDLLDDPATAKFLHHCYSITEPIITGLYRLPAALRRPAVMTMFHRIDGMDRFVGGLRLVASRAGLPFDQLATEIGSLAQPDQVTAKIRRLVDSLPLPETLPPTRIGGFRRVDSVIEVRALAKQWQNCLADYVQNINDGTSAVYLSENLEAVCFLCRHGRMGWFLVQAKGPNNADIDPHHLAQIRNAFAGAEILEASVIEPIKAIVLAYDWLHPRLAPDPDEIFDDIALY